VSLFKHKTMASLKVAVESRGSAAQSDLSMKKRALIKRISLFLFRGWAQHIFDRWRDTVSSDPSPSASENFDLLPCDIPLDFLFRSAHRVIDVPGAQAPYTIFKKPTQLLLPR